MPTASGWRSCTSCAGASGAAGGKSICLLLRGSALSETSRARLALMRETNDGFRIAEEDLRLRGGGRIARHAAVGRGDVPAGDARDARRAAADRATAMRGCWSIATAGWQGPRGQAARTALYLFERDAAVGAAAVGLAQQDREQLVIVRERDRAVELAADPPAERPADVGRRPSPTPAA